jgi:hypothetical protein
MSNTMFSWFKQSVWQPLWQKSQHALTQVGNTRRGVAKPLKQGWQRLKKGPGKIKLGQTTKTLLPYTPLMAAPNMFYNTIPHVLTQYQKNQASRDFTYQYQSALGNPSVSNVGRMHQGYYNYTDRFGAPPYLVKQSFADQSGLKAGWTALSHSPGQLAQAKVLMPQQTAFNHRYPAAF